MLYMAKIKYVINDFLFISNYTDTQVQQQVFVRMPHFEDIILGYWKDTKYHALSTHFSTLKKTANLLIKFFPSHLSSTQIEATLGWFVCTVLEGSTIHTTFSVFFFSYFFLAHLQRKPTPSQVGCVWEGAAERHTQVVWIWILTAVAKVSDRLEVYTPISAGWRSEAGWAGRQAGWFRARCIMSLGRANVC